MNSHPATKSRKSVYIFLVFFTLVIICKCLNLSTISELVPYSFLYSAYIFLWGTLAFLNFSIKRHISESTKIMLALMIYYIIWGLNNIKHINYDDAFGNMVRSIIFVFFIIVSCYWVKKYNCIKNIINILYISFASYLIIWLIIIIKDINLMRTFSTFWIADNNIRYRNYFGFRYPNIAAEMAVSTIILSKKVRYSIFFKYVINGIMLFVVLANNSRGSLLGLVLFELLYRYIKIWKKRNFEKTVKKTWKIILFCFLVAIIYIIYLLFVKHMTLFEILSGTNRETAIEENILLLKNSGRWLFGVGRLTGGFFAEKNILYGARTGYLEVFYFEIFITTGVIGSVWMILLMYRYIKDVINCSDENEKGSIIWVFCVLIYMLFISLFEVYFFSYIYATSMCFNIILLSFIDTNLNNKKI